MPEIKLKHVVSCSSEDSVSITSVPLPVSCLRSSHVPDLMFIIMWKSLSRSLAVQTHKADNLLSSETYRKWKSAHPGEKQVSVIMQVRLCNTSIMVFMVVEGFFHGNDGVDSVCVEFYGLHVGCVDGVSADGVCFDGVNCVGVVGV